MVQQLRLQGREWRISLANCEAYLSTEDYRVIEDEITRILHIDLKC
jgi:hypothetical protein